jgi:hypothetical protein
MMVHCSQVIVDALFVFAYFCFLGILIVSPVLFYCFFF